jgi:lysophospholipase L1-like esterase
VFIGAFFYNLKRGNLKRAVLGAGLLWAFAGADGNTIAILGSSTAAGTGATNYDSAFAGRYAKYLGGLKPAWKLVNLAVGGYTTYQVMPTGYKPPAGRPDPDTARNITKVLALKPHSLLICLPSNDINSNYPASEFNANFDSLHAWATRAGIKVWITTPLPRSALDSARRMILLQLKARILSRYAPRAIDFYDSLGDANGNYYPAFNSGDGIHTNDRGHKILFERTVAANLTEIPSAVALGGRGVESGRTAQVAAGLPRLVLDARRGRMVVLPAGTGPGLDLRGRSLPY